MGVTLFRKLKDVSITKKLYFTVGVMALLICIELVTLFFSVHTLSSVRAYVGGEGLWSKGQKDAAYHLQRYATTRSEHEYQLFKEHMKVPIGDSKARLELAKAKPDLEVARQGFIEGRNHPDDVDGMVT
ncbi:MAG: hybrid sensor histidine kinase/response regulator, partial [Bacteroidetes bacterium]|nr:hybrid sensor histidine kinase/response regulator [Bacteroidota bacterium]